MVKVNKQTESVSSASRIRYNLYVREEKSVAAVNRSVIVMLSVTVMVMESVFVHCGMLIRLTGLLQTQQPRIRTRT